ncbi:DUF3006 domain-containing protein [Alkalicoccus urumqiensis]|uniref:DUF3006 domain-containing protein n=1 Tax=Alkalicoccus urumqiensis TaxID=1548213 RepID=UPI0015E62458|nr:DUF3006 domain-containing protein [Alkalicoccus urumqiensis]
MTYHGVIDRIEDNDTAVLLHEEAGTQYDLPADSLPEGVREGDHVTFSLEEGAVVNITADREAADAAYKRIQEKQERLQKRSGGSRRRRKREQD